MLNFDDAIKLIDSNISEKKIITLPLEKCSGLVLAEKILAPVDIPAFTNSAMDGFAVIAADLKSQSVKLEIIETVAAGSQSTKNVDSGKCVAIMTGAPLPRGADAVVKVEETKREGNLVEIFVKVAKGENVRFKGEEAKKGEELIPAGTVITPGVIGLISSLGKTEIQVNAPPKVSVIITGDEVLPPGSPFREGKIIDATGPGLKSALFLDKIPIVFFEYAKDDPEELDKKIRAAISCSDVVLIAGGASMGKYDFVQDILVKNEVKKIFWKVAVKPGKPIWFGKRADKMVFNLPGNPVSVLVTYYLYVRFALKRMIGYNFASAGLERATAKISETIFKEDPRLEFVRGIFDGGGNVTPLRQRGSAMLSGMARANCLINFPCDSKKIFKGEKVEILKI